MKNPASANDVSRLLGDVDPLAIERIIATGATSDEIVEAFRATQDEYGFGEESHEPSSPAVAEVRAVLDELAILDDDARDENENDM
jgi:hypothetical protein